jgi:hypothetical protein
MEYNSRPGFGLVIGLIDHLYTHLGTTSNYSAIANLHNSQITTVLAKSFPACSVFTSRSLVTASNSGDSSALHAQALSSQPPVQDWHGCPNFLPYNSSAWPTETPPFILVCLPVAAGTCVTSRSLAAAAYSCLLRICRLTKDVIPVYISRPLPRNECYLRAVL